MAIADSYDGFLLDLDGVVWLGHEFLPGAADAINGLISAGNAARSPLWTYGTTIRCPELYGYRLRST